MDRVISHDCVSQSAGRPQDQDIDSKVSNQPPRPASRLGFNSAEVLKCSTDVPAGVDAGQWTRSLFQNGPIAELRLASFALPKMDDDMAPICAQPSGGMNDRHCTSNVNEPTSVSQSCSSISTTIDGATPVCAGETNVPQCSVNEPTSVSRLSVCTSDVTSSPPRKSPSVSRLCFPFAKSTPRRAKEQPPSPPPTRHKHSCFPTLLSPTPAGRPFPAQPRHKYHQHGYSRVALQNLKWFWSTREETWDGVSVNAKAYGGIVEATPETTRPQPTMATTTKKPARALAPEPDSDSNVDCVYPRQGDIAALRDPYCADIDRCFANLPVWTMNKTLWMRDVHMAVQMRVVEDEESDEEDGDETEEETEDDEDGELESLSSTHFSDDSDTTLVESESEAEASTTISVSGTNDIDGDDGGIGATSTSGGLHQKGKVPTIVYADQILPKVAQNREGLPRSTIATVMKVTGKTETNFRPTTYQWPTDWYRRWDVLVDLSRQNGAETNNSCIRGSPLPHLFSAPRTAGRHENNSCTQ
ncbi:hypothetical protein HYPSUDRAFT_622808 [Hypholoma sublateritium FD-334 SS-4]|uniref:Uncharacterized protein n=1 Tax=Hypholoma sublateritium (strain FD-334 SS-4) TaxID=945553 RepID=A0A0D2LLK9_HYPSF|nr:hypothetical protein HYPSUDRAFT_622808 [Hypholoma sublateritium FD-334 SS-4]